MNQNNTGHICPACGGKNVESRGSFLTLFPRRADKPGRQILDIRYRCRDCSHEFTTREEREYRE